MSSTRRAFCALFVALTFGAVPALSQSAPPAATDVTIRLFFSQNIDALTITPASQAITVRRCPRCSEQPLRSPLSVQLQDGKMLVNGATTGQLEFAGSARIEAAGGRTAAAAGKWQLRPRRDGLHLTVTIPSERYVMAVLMSESDPQEPAASLQALAIAARSFALTQLKRHGTEGFDLCDSTHCQALRLAPVSDAIRNAVEATAGETIWFHDHRATAYFTQNCGGVSEDAAQLWGGHPKLWLTSHPDPWCQRTPSAWHASLSQAELQQALAFAGWPLHSAVSNILILKHDPSGRAATLGIVTANQQITLPAATFRFAIGRTLGWNRLRSDWYAVNFSKGVAQFDGKGFGHGVGLCQAGAAAMAATQHADMRSILRFYFPGTEVRISASDQGWLSASGQGWTLFDTSSSDDVTLLREGNTAWVHAHALLGSQQLGANNDQRISVRIFPSTELFRASTGEPGWAIGATRGNAISLQRLRIIALLHEMLHVLVERNSKAATPLWLREGLVEALSSANFPDPHTAQPGMSTEEINAALWTSSSLEEAHHAHQAAATLTRHLINIYGLATVRGWLGSGVPPGTLAKAGLR